MKNSEKKNADQFQIMENMTEQCRMLDRNSAGRYRIIEKQFRIIKNKIIDQIHVSLNIKEKVNEQIDESSKKMKNVNMNSEMYEHRLNNVEGFVWLAFICVIFEGCIILWLVKKLTVKGNRELVRNDNRRKQILDVDRGQLENGFCVISFQSETQKHHERLLNFAKESGVPGVSFRIRISEDIRLIPRRTSIFVCIDVNDRHIIVENPTDLGDIKFSTIESAKTMEADVFVLYVGDKGSQELSQGELYNTNLRAFTHHEDLKKITEKNRSLSVFQELTVDQNNHIRNIIVNQNPEENREQNI